MLRILQSLKENSTQAIHFLSGRPGDQELEIKRYTLALTLVLKMNATVHNLLLL